MLWHPAEYVSLTLLTSHHLSARCATLGEVGARRSSRTTQHSPPAFTVVLLIRRRASHVEKCGAVCYMLTITARFRFQKAAKAYGVPEEEIFQTADLYDMRNIAQVTLSLYALARLVSLSLSHSCWHCFPLNYMERLSTSNSHGLVFHHRSM